MSPYCKYVSARLRAIDPLGANDGAFARDENKGGHTPHIWEGLMFACVFIIIIWLWLLFVQWLLELLFFVMLPLKHFVEQCLQFYIV